LHQDDYSDEFDSCEDDIHAVSRREDKTVRERERGGEGKRQRERDGGREKRERERGRVFTIPTII